MNIFIDSFSNATVLDLKECGRNENGVLNALRINNRISTFDMSENTWLVDIIESLEKKKFIIPLKEDYPWHRWMITEAGEKYLTL